MLNNLQRIIKSTLKKLCTITCNMYLNYKLTNITCAWGSSLKIGNAGGGGGGEGILLALKGGGRGSSSSATAINSSGITSATRRRTRAARAHIPQRYLVCVIWVAILVLPFGGHLKIKIYLNIIIIYLLLTLKVYLFLMLIILGGEKCRLDVNYIVCLVLF